MDGKLVLNIGSCLSFNIACGFSAGFFYFGSKQIKKGHLYFIIPKPVSEKNSRRHEFEGFFIGTVNESIIDISILKKIILALSQWLFR